MAAGKKRGFESYVPPRERRISSYDRLRDPRDAREPRQAGNDRQSWSSSKTRLSSYNNTKFDELSYDDPVRSVDGGHSNGGGDVENHNTGKASRHQRYLEYSTQSREYSHRRGNGNPGLSSSSQSSARPSESTRRYHPSEPTSSSNFVEPQEHSNTGNGRGDDYKLPEWYQDTDKNPLHLPSYLKQDILQVMVHRMKRSFFDWALIWTPEALHSSLRLVAVELELRYFFQYVQRQYVPSTAVLNKNNLFEIFRKVSHINHAWVHPPPGVAAPTAAVIVLMLDDCILCANELLDKDAASTFGAWRSELLEWIDLEKAAAGADEKPDEKGARLSKLEKTIMEAEAAAKAYDRAAENVEVPKAYHWTIAPGQSVLMVQDVGRWPSTKQDASSSLPKHKLEKWTNLEDGEVAESPSSAKRARHNPE